MHIATWNKPNPKKETTYFIIPIIWPSGKSYIVEIVKR